MGNKSELEQIKKLSKIIGEIADKLLHTYNVSINNSCSNNLYEFKTPIENLNLSTLCYNALKCREVNYIEHAMKLSPKELLRIRGFGKACLTELIAKIVEFKQATRTFT